VGGGPGTALECTDVRQVLSDGVETGVALNHTTGDPSHEVASESDCRHRGFKCCRMRDREVTQRFTNCDDYAAQGIPRNALPTLAMAPPEPTLTRSPSYGLPALARRSHRMTTSRGWSEHPFVGWLGYHVLRCFGWEAATVQGEEALGGLREHGSCGGQSP